MNTKEGGAAEGGPCVRARRTSGPGACRGMAGFARHALGRGADAPMDRAGDAGDSGDTGARLTPPRRYRRCRRFRRYRSAADAATALQEMQEIQEIQEGG